MTQKTTIWLLLFVAFSLSTTFCTTAETKEISLEDRILAVNKILVDSNQNIILANAREYIQLTHEYILKGTDDKKIVRYANQGAQVATNIKDFPIAMTIYDDLATHFSTNPKVVANSLFAKAFILENNLQDVDAAKKLFQKIQKEYPNQAITKSIPATLDNLGKTEAELLEMLKKQKKNE